LRSFGIDTTNPEEYIYALAGQFPATSIIRYTASGGTWTTILDAGSMSGGDTQIYDFTVNRGNGGLYALTEGGPGAPGVHISTDRGASWSRATTLSGGGLNSISAYNNTIIYGFNSGAGGHPWIGYSTNNGSSWTNYQLAGFSSWNVENYLNYVLGNWAYSDAGIANSVHRYQLGSPPSVQIGSLANWPGWSGWSPDPDDGTHVRMVYDAGVGSNRLYTTTDNWAADVTDAGALDIGEIGGVDREINHIVELVASDDFDMILYGSNDPQAGNEHTIYAAYGETDLTPEGKSGANPDTGVSSIHYLAGGPCRRGIQVYTGI
jgi:hypothetical protein